MDSILTSIKKQLGIAEEYDHFDPEIIMHVNSVFMVLTQIGVGPATGFVIKDASAKWTDFIPDTDLIRFEGIKTYIYLKVRLIFDAQMASGVIESIKEQIRELEWRLNINAESVGTNDIPKINTEEILNELLNKIQNGDGVSY